MFKLCCQGKSALEPYILPPCHGNELVNRYFLRDVAFGIEEVDGSIDLNVYIVTLDSTPTRLAYMREALAHHGLRATICIMSAPSDSVYASYMSTSPRRPLSKGELGCSASHSWILAYASYKSKQNVIVLEDDAMFRRDFSLVTLPVPAPVVLLGASDWHKSKRTMSVGYYDAHKHDGRTCGSFAYLITSEGARTMSKYLREKKCPADHAFHNLWATIRVCEPPLLVSDRSTTSIAEHKDHEFIYVRVCLEGVELTGYNTVCLRELTNLHAGLEYSSSLFHNLSWDKEHIDSLSARQRGVFLSTPVLHPYRSVKDVAVAIATFHPTGARKPIENLLHTVAQFRGVLPVYIVELCYHRQLPHITLQLLKDWNCANVSVLCVRSESVMFHKENLWMVLEKKIPHEKIVFLDGDILLKRPDVWACDVSDALDKYDVIQPLSSVTFQEVPDGSVCSKQPLLVATHAVRSMAFDPRMAYPSPGYALGVRKDWVRRVGGIVQMAVCGGGDLMTLGSLVVPAHVASSHAYSASPFAHRDIARFQEASKGTRVSFLPHTAVHLYHGSRDSRQYKTRHDPFLTLKESDLYKNKDGVLEFKSKKWNVPMELYFQKRET